MRELLRRLRLIDSLTTTLQTSKVEFVNRLKEITDQGSTGMMSDTFDVFSSSENEFKGEVNFESFKIKRKKKYFDKSMNFAVATGTFDENNGELTIKTEINGFTTYFIISYVFLIIFYPIFITVFFSIGSSDGFPPIPFIVLHGTLMFSILYLMARRSVKRLKYDLEREFFYLTQSK